MICPACHNKTAPPGMECYLCGPSVKRPRGFNKPHLRLHYTPSADTILGPRPNFWPWTVHMVRDMRKNYGRPNVTTNRHQTAKAACVNAAILWWPDC